MVTARYVRLRASDKFHSRDSTKFSFALQAILDAGLFEAYISGPSIALTVGDYLLHSPSLFRKVAEDETFDLNRAHAAALRYAERFDGDDEARRISFEDEDSGAMLVLLRPTQVELKDDLSSDDYRRLTYDLHLSSGDIIEVTGERELPRRMWAVIKVSATIERKREVAFTYETVLAVPDNGALRISDADPSLSQSLCFDTVCRFLLAGLDLSEESLPNAAAATDFINQIHTKGLPRGRMPEAGTFRERLLEAMRPISESAGNLAGPGR